MIVLNEYQVEEVSGGIPVAAALILARAAAVTGPYIKAGFLAAVGSIAYNLGYDHAFE